MPVQRPQSVAHVTQLSPARKSHTKSPHCAPQSRPQVTWTCQTHVASHPATQQNESTSQIRRTQGSQAWESGAPTAHSEWAHEDAPQSAGHVPEVSKASQEPLPQDESQAPQSAGHPAQLSPRYGSQSPSPQAVAQGPQSREQLAQVSPPPQTPSPQPAGHAPQSSEQLAQVSPPQ